MRLNLENAAGHVEEFLFAFAGLHAHLAGLEVRQQRRVARCDAELTHDRRCEEHFGVA
jgi:hypothetical protein